MHNKYEMNILNTYDQKKMEDKINKQTKKTNHKNHVWMNHLRIIFIFIENSYSSKLWS